MKREPPAPSFLPWTEHALHIHHTALLVAASGAFPGAFKPVRINISGKLPPNSAVRNPMILSDGGIGDNLGLVLLYSAKQLADSGDTARVPSKRWNVNVVIASDASALTAPHIPSNTLRVLSAAIDVVARTSGAAGLVNVDPAPVILSPAPLVRDLQRALSKADAPEGLVSLPFDGPARQSVNNGGSQKAADSAEQPRLSYWNLDINDLRFFAAHMKVARADSTALKAELAAAETRMADDSTHAQRGKSAELLEHDLHHRIELELARRIKVFINTSTLDDRVSPENAEALYILGQYLVVLNKRFIRFAIQNTGPRKIAALTAGNQGRM